jgi:hypothetical protein
MARYEIEIPEGTHVLLEDESLQPEFDWPVERTAFARDLIGQVSAYFKDIAKKRNISPLMATKATPLRKASLAILYSGMIYLIYQLGHAKIYALFLVSPISNII